MREKRGKENEIGFQDSIEEGDQGEYMYGQENQMGVGVGKEQACFNCKIQNNSRRVKLGQLEDKSYRSRSGIMELFTNFTIEAFLYVTRGG